MTSTKGETVVTTDHSQYFLTPRPRPIRPPRLHHATFMTMDVDAMVAFYELVAGLQPVYYAQHAAWLTNDEANHRIALLRLPGVHPPQDKPHSAGLHHTAFEYASFDEWLDNYIRLRDVGVTPKICLDHGMTMSMYYQDPDGNGVEIQVDAFNDWTLSKEWMWASQEFSADQIGPQFDPEKLVAARESGLDGAEIHKRARAGEYFPVNPRLELTFDDPWPEKLAADPSLADGVPFPPAPEN
jgi:catechol 2,3-dioxygenase